jgi:hypothetical protein
MEGEFMVNLLLGSVETKIAVRFFCSEERLNPPEQRKSAVSIRPEQPHTFLAKSDFKQICNI